MAMEDKNPPVQPDAVEATETRGRKVGAARFFELLGRDLWPFYKASILCVLGFAPGYAAVLFSAMAASLPLCLLSGAVGGLMGLFRKRTASHISIIRKKRRRALG